MSIPIPGKARGRLRLQGRFVPELHKDAPLAEEFASRYDHKLYVAIAHRARGVSHRLAGQYADAETRLTRALDIFQQLETRWQIGRTLFELGELSLSRAEKQAADQNCARTLSMFEVMGAQPDIAPTREKLA